MIKSDITQDMIMDYCKNHSNDNSPILKEIEKHTWDNEEIPKMISGQLVGNFLQLIIHSIRFSLFPYVIDRFPVLLLSIKERP